jgi:2-oxoglutarate/2-oxoacid ferredoxin oxidoreductase subunit alpha
MNGETVRILMSGTAGDRIVSAANLLHETASDSGIFSYLYKSIPSSIRSGTVRALLSFSNTPIVSPVGDCSIEAYFSGDAAGLHYKSSDSKTVFVFDNVLEVNDDSSLVTVDKATQKYVSAPSFFTGMISYLIHLKPPSFIPVLQKNYSENPLSVQSIQGDILKGFLFAKSIFTDDKRYQFINEESRLVSLDGNTAFAEGALEAGCRFFASYPISPATTIGDYLAHELPKVNGTVYQAEDEIAAIGTITGASFAGVKAMTATSGPGFSLMQEFISYLSTAEVPSVIVNVQRAGPSSGIPTHHGQEDLLPAVFGGHGDEHRIVIAPSSVKDCYHTAIDAFNMAERYASPVIVLSSCALAQGNCTIESSDLQNMIEQVSRDSGKALRGENRFERYADDNVVNPCLPEPTVSKGTYCITGLEHDQSGYPTECADIRAHQLARRQSKLSAIEKEHTHLIEFDIDTTIKSSVDFSITAWGADCMAVREAVSKLRKKGFLIAAMYSQIVFPVCQIALNKLVEHSYLLFLPETNASGQYARLIRMETGISPISLTFADGEPMNPDRCAAEIETLIIKRHRNDE